MNAASSKAAVIDGKSTQEEEVRSRLQADELSLAAEIAQRETGAQCRRSRRGPYQDREQPR
jgi:hypothetical protein